MPSVLSHPQFHNEEVACAWVEEPILVEWPVCPGCKERERVAKLAGKSTCSKKAQTGARARRGAAVQPWSRSQPRSDHRCLARCAGTGESRASEAGTWGIPD